MRLGLECGAYTLDSAVELGIGGVPIDAEALVSQGVQATLQPIRERGLSVCQIGAFGFNPLSIDQEKQAAQRTMLERAVSLAPETGCTYIVICGGNFHPTGFLGVDIRNFTSDALTRVAEELRPLLRLAEQYNVQLSVEPYLKTIIHTPEAFLRLHEMLGSDALRINIDVTSFYRYEDMLSPHATIEHVCTALAGHYGLAHVKEIALIDDFHIHIGLTPVGMGPTPWAQVLKWIAPHMPADSWLILEHVLTPEEARNSVQLLRDAATQAGVVLN